MVEHQIGSGTGAIHGHTSTTSALDPHERQVLKALAMGLSSAEAADRLSLPIETVRDQARSAIVKLGARSKIEAVVIALRRRLIELAPD